jgi:hypothetical protein
MTERALHDLVPEMRSVSTARDYVRRNTRTALGVMLLGGGVAAGSLVLAVSGCFLLPLRRIAGRAWRPHKAEQDRAAALLGVARPLQKLVA